MAVPVFVEAEKSHTWGLHISEAGAPLSQADLPPSIGLKSWQGWMVTRVSPGHSGPSTAAG